MNNEKKNSNSKTKRLFVNKKCKQTIKTEIKN